MCLCDVIKFKIYPDSFICILIFSVLYFCFYLNLKCFCCYLNLKCFLLLSKLNVFLLLFRFKVFLLLSKLKAPIHQVELLSLLLLKNNVLYYSRKKKKNTDYQSEVASLTILLIWYYSHLFKLSSLRPLRFDDIHKYPDVWWLQLVLICWWFGWLRI